MIEKKPLSPATLAELQSVPAAFLPEELFVQIARLTVLSAVELVCVRTAAGGQVEVLLTQRAEVDPFWPGEWHCPGSVLRPTDEKETFVSGFHRVLAGELGLTEWAEPTFAGVWFWEGVRGSALSVIFWLDVTGLTMPVGKFFPASALPDKLIIGMDRVIEIAVQHYIKHSGSA